MMPFILMILNIANYIFLNMYYLYAYNIQMLQKTKRFPRITFHDIELNSILALGSNCESNLLYFDYYHHWFEQLNSNCALGDNFYLIDIIVAFLDEINTVKSRVAQQNCVACNYCYVSDTKYYKAWCVSKLFPCTECRAVFCNKCWKTRVIDSQNRHVYFDAFDGESMLHRKDMNPKFNPAEENQYLHDE
jgi:hypothetical protein